MVLKRFRYGHLITLHNTENAMRHYARGLPIQQVIAEVGYFYGPVREYLHESGVAMWPMCSRKRAGSVERSGEARTQ